ncbi:MAG: hypothetical protein J5676_03435 [Bacteroidaceae bacterium]|nr:hypothetical protein [Bacteroidaceae bacterium]
MKNLLLSFIYLMLCAPLCTKAQVNVSTSAQLKDAFAEYSKISQYQTAYDNAVAKVNSIQGQLGNTQQLVTVEVYDELTSQCYDVYAEVESASNLSSTTEINNKLKNVKLYLQTVNLKSLSDDAWDAYYDWIDENGYEDDDESIDAFLALEGNEQYAETVSYYNVYPVNPNLLNGATGEQKSAYDVFRTVRNKEFYLFYRTKIGANFTTDKEANNGIGNVNGFLKAIAVVTKLQSDALNNTLTTTVQENPIYVQLSEKLEDANAEMTAAYANLDNANNAAEINIEASFATDAYISKYGGTINGNARTLTLTTNEALIGTLSANGKVNNLCVANAVIARSNDGNYKNCCTVGDNIIGYVGNDGVTYSSLLALAADMNMVYGCDVNDPTSLVPVTQNTKVYKYAYYALTSKNVKKTGYVNSVGGSLVGKPTLNDNEFLILESENTNTAITEKNIIENTSENGYVCNYCYLTDSKEFYAPVAFTATKLDYSRSFSAVWSSLILPFEVNSTVLEKIGVSRVNEFTSYENHVSTFTTIQGGMEAYTPYIILPSSSGKVFSNIEDAVFPKSPSTDLTRLGNNGYFYGNLGPKQEAINHISDGEKYNVYGFNTKNQMVRAIGTSYFSAFRCYLRAIESDGAEAKVRVVLRDENGNMLDGETTAVDAVSTENFTVSGANGVIVVNSDKSQNVLVYTSAGKLVKSAEVAEGETTISVNPGMYIVNGQKVLVK